MAPDESQNPISSTAEPDWTDQVTEFVVDTVGKVGDATTGKVMPVAKISVYVLAAAFVAVMVLVVGYAFFSRVLAIIPGEMWMKYLAIGAIFSISGLVTWSKRGPA